MEDGAAFEEARNAGRRHFHSLVKLATKAGRIWRMDQKMFEMRNAETCTGGVRGYCAKPQRRASRYLTRPRTEKPFVGEQRYVANEKPIPMSLWGRIPDEQGATGEQGGDPRGDPPRSAREGRVAPYFDLFT